MTARAAVDTLFMAATRLSIRCRGPRPDERGSALLETAFVAPLFLLLLLASIEGGTAFFERLSVANAALAGARSASGQGNEALSDFNVLRSMRTGGPAGAEFTMIVIFKATGPDSAVPGACRTSSIASLCNRYVPADFTRPSTDFGCTGPPGPATKIDAYWCPTGRKIALSGPKGPPDHVGVYVEAVHGNLTGVLGEIVLRSTSVFRMEPWTLT